MGHLSNQWAGSRVLFEKSTSDRKRCSTRPRGQKIRQDVTRPIKQCLEPSRQRGMREGSRNETPQIRGQREPVARELAPARLRSSLKPSCVVCLAKFDCRFWGCCAARREQAPSPQ